MSDCAVVHKGKCGQKCEELAAASVLAFRMRAEEVDEETAEACLCIAELLEMSYGGEE